MAHHRPSPHHRFLSEKEFLEFSGEEAPLEKDLAAIDAEAEEEFFEEIAERDSTELLTSEDIDSSVTYPLVAWAHPPLGIPGQCLELLWCKWKWYVWLRSQFLVSEYNKIQSGVIRGYLSVHNDRYLHILMNPYMIHPYSNFAFFWIVFTGIFSSAFVIYSPYIISFFPNAFFKKYCLTLIELECSILFADVLMNFCIGNENPFSRDIYLDRKMVATKYLKGWFIIDVLTRIPLDYIIFASLEMNHQTTREELGYIRILAFFLRLMRFRPVYRFLNKLSNMFVLKASMTSWMIEILTVFFFVLHWLACFNWLLPSIYNDPINPKPKSWVTKRPDNLWTDQKWIQYVNCYLRALSYICTVDGGNFTPLEVDEIICSIVGIFCAQTFYAYFIASFTIMVSEINEATEKYSEMLELAEDYLKHNKSTENYRERVMLYFERKFQRHVFPDTFLLGTLSPILRDEILTHNCRALVERTSIFHDLPPYTVTDISKHLQYEVYVPGDILLEPNTIGDRMYFIQTGEVDILSPFGVLITTLSDGHFFGEIALISGEKRLKTAVARSVCEIYILTKKNFNKCVDTCPLVYERILNIAEARLQAEYEALVDADKRREEFHKWKEAKKKLKEDIEEDEKSNIIKTYGLHFVNEHGGEDTISDFGIENHHHNPKTHHVHRKVSHHSTKHTGAAAPEVTSSQSVESDKSPHKNTVQNMISNVMNMASSIRKEDRRKQKEREDNTKKKK